jgi:hypothetical protein
MSSILFHFILRAALRLLDRVILGSADVVASLACS